MIETTIHGVPFQTVMTVSERTFVLGKIVTRHPNAISGIDIAGMHFSYEERSIPRGYQMARRHFLRGEGWETVMTTLLFQPLYEMDFTRPRERIYKDVPAHVVRWGKERFLEPQEVSFAGDGDTFKANMLYVKMIGADQDDWQETIDALA